MHSRVPTRLFSVVLATALALALSLPAAAHSSEPPFSITFPQETSKTTFSSSYGDYRSGGRRHRGNDLLAPRMTEVYAIADGTVIHVGTNYLSGRNLRIQHEDDWTSHYVHLNNDNVGTDDGAAPWALTVAPGVEVGATVVEGQLIGWVGDSGNAETTTSHTHFELRHHGVAINPYTILSEAFDRDRAREMQMLAEIEAALIEEPDQEIE